MAIRTGADYVAALRDGRVVRHAGRVITDVTTHPGLAGTVRTLAELYDKQHDPAFAETMTVARGGGTMSYSYLPPTSLDELRAKRRNIELWSDQTFGLMGRFPEFCAELVVGLLDGADDLARHDPRWGANARAYHRHCIDADLCLTHALNDQYYDRTKRASDQPDPDLILHVVRETSAGPVVRGLRTLATLAPLADEVLVYPNRPRAPDEPDYALAFALPLNAPGLSIVCRDLYGEHGDPERLPLSTRFDEVDAALIFDDVVVPWERIFVYREPRLAAGFIRTIHRWAAYSTMVRLIVKLETFQGVTHLLTTWANRHGAPGAQALLGTFVEDLQVLRACVAAAETDAQRTASGLLAPTVLGGYRLFGIEASDRADRLMQDLLTSSLVLTGGVSDLDDPVVGALIDRFFRNNAPSTPEHLRLLAVAADMVMTPFATRNRLYERLQSGEPDALRARLAAEGNDSPGVQRVQRFLTSLARSRPSLLG